MNKLHSNSLSYLMLGGGSVALLSWLASVPTVAQAVLGLLVVLVLPGYALTSVLFTRQQLGWAERALLVVSSSLVTTILGSLVLHQSGWGLQQNTWLAICVIVTLVGGLGAWLLRRRDSSVNTPSIQLGFSISQMGLLGLAVLLIGFAFTTARSAAPATSYQSYTMLWMTPQPANALNRIQVGVSSKEFAATQFKLELKVNDQLAQAWPLLELTPNQQWLASFELPVAQPVRDDSTDGSVAPVVSGAVHRVEAILYRIDQPEQPYRHVVLYPTQQSESQWAGVIP